MTRLLSEIQGTWLRQVTRLLPEIQGTWLRQVTRLLSDIQGTWLRQVTRLLSEIQGTCLRQVTRLLSEIQGIWSDRLLDCNQLKYREPVQTDYYWPRQVTRLLLKYGEPRSER